MIKKSCEWSYLQDFLYLPKSVTKYHNVILSNTYYGTIYVIHKKWLTIHVYLYYHKNSL